MKNLIRKWLEIKDPFVGDERMLRRMIGEAIQSALNGENDSQWTEYVSPWFKNTLNKALERAARDTAIKEAREEVHAKIGGEDFINNVVERINQKQLK